MVYCFKLLPSSCLQLQETECFSVFFKEETEAVVIKLCSRDESSFGNVRTVTITVTPPQCVPDNHVLRDTA